MPDNDESALEQLEAVGAEIETLAARLAVRAHALSPELGTRIELVKQRLKVALDELARTPQPERDITDE